MKELKEAFTIHNLIKEEGSFLFVYNANHSVYYIYADSTTESVWIIMTDKYFNIEGKIEVEHGKILFKNKKVNWLKPNCSNNFISFLGKVTEGDKSYHFSFNSYNGKLNLNEQPKGTKDIPSSYSLLSCMSNIEVTHAIQRWGNLYFIGNDKSDPENKVAVYGEVDLSKDKLSKVYYLYSDLGEITPSAISIDSDENKVYLVGKTTKEDGGVIPFIDTLLHNKQPCP